MRYGVALPNYGALAQPEHIVRAARHAEDAGVDSVWVSDHVIVPNTVESSYPYDRTAVPRAANLTNLERFYDALTTLAFVAGATTRIRLGVSAFVLPIRNPVVTAKTVATLDVLSGGRLLFAVGSGWLAEEFAVLHTPFADRGARTDEYIRICKACWTDDDVQLDGPSYRTAAFRCAPKPLQQPHPPIWIGGNGSRALQRTATLGDGWHPIDLGPAEIRSQLTTLSRMCSAADRDVKDITVSLRAPLSIIADADQYADAGVDYLVLNPRRGGAIDDLLADIDQIAGVCGRNRDR